MREHFIFKEDKPFNEIAYLHIFLPSKPAYPLAPSWLPIKPSSIRLSVCPKAPPPIKLYDKYALFWGIYITDILIVNFCKLYITKIAIYNYIYTLYI